MRFPGLLETFGDSAQQGPHFLIQHMLCSFPAPGLLYHNPLNPTTDSVCPASLTLIWPNASLCSWV